MPSTCEATVFYDDVGEASARLYALAAPQIDGRYLTVDELAACRLDCRVEGPTCRYSTTLQSRSALNHRGVTNWGDIPAVMAEGFLPDPCPWSPELPFLYRLVGTVKRGDRTIAEIDQAFGIRPVSVVHNRIVLNGKIWVPRGVGCVIADVPLSNWRETATVRVGLGDDRSLQQASEAGVVSCPFVDGDVGARQKETRRLSRYPAVALIHFELPITPDVAACARNTLFMTPRLENDADNLAHVEYVYIAPGGASWSWPTHGTKPIAVMRPALVRDSVDKARAACDILQRDMAGKCDPAGYFV